MLMPLVIVCVLFNLLPSANVLKPTLFLKKSSFLLLSIHAGHSNNMMRTAVVQILVMGMAGAYKGADARVCKLGDIR